MCPGGFSGDRDAVGGHTSHDPFWNLWPVVLSGEGCWGLLPGRAHITSFLLIIGRCLWSKQLTFSHRSDQGRHPFRPVRHLVGSSRAGRCLKMPWHCLHLRETRQDRCVCFQSDICGRKCVRVALVDDAQPVPAPAPAGRSPCVPGPSTLVPAGKGDQALPYVPKVPGRLTKTCACSLRPHGFSLMALFWEDTWVGTAGTEGCSG